MRVQVEVTAVVVVVQLVLLTVVVVVDAGKVTVDVTGLLSSAPKSATQHHRSCWLVLRRMTEQNAEAAGFWAKAAHSGFFAESQFGKRLVAAKASTARAKRPNKRHTRILLLEIRPS